MQTISDPLNHQAVERKERILQAYYEHLWQIDQNNRDLSSFFFAVNTAMLAIVMQLLKADWQRLVLAIVGYVASVALTLIGYKSVWSWRAYAEEMHCLEKELGYGITEKYDGRLHRSPAASVRITLVRLRFSFLFLVVWVFFLVYLVFTIPPASPLLPSFLHLLFGGLFVMVIVILPWAYLAGTLRPRVLWAVLRAPWAREV